MRYTVNNQQEFARRLLAQRDLEGLLKAAHRCIESAYNAEDEPTAVIAYQIEQWALARCRQAEQWFREQGMEVVVCNTDDNLLLKKEEHYCRVFFMTTGVMLVPVEELG